MIARVAIGYTIVALMMTWPLAPRMAREVAWDLGDPLLNIWILGWVCDHLWRALGGDVGALGELWNANIFHPEPLTLAYSEHLVAQAVQVLPIYALTKNLILCYNLVFLSTFVLSALGMFLLVRELTGSVRAAIVAGLIYGFIPYRIGQFSHLQTMSSQWMPFVLYALRRYFAHVDANRPRVAALAGATAALVAQNLSCGYYLVYFAPFAAIYALYEIVDRGLWRRFDVWRDLAGMGVVTAAATAPFLIPYLRVREHGIMSRTIDEAILFSADVYSYLTAHDQLHIWGALQVFPKAEGELFPGAIPIVLAAIGVGAHLATAWRARLDAPAAPPTWPRRLARAAIVVGAIYAMAAVIVILFGAVAPSFYPLPISRRGLWRLIAGTGVMSAILLAISPRARALVRGRRGEAAAFYAWAALLTFWLSLGPAVRTLGRRLGGVGLYSLLYWYVPGFDGLRVPARFGMLVMVCLATLAGYGAAAIERRGRWGATVVLVCGALFLAEANITPMPVSVSWTPPNLASPPALLATSRDRIPAVYKEVLNLPATAVLVEFPFGDPGWDVHYMYYSTFHWRRLINGYSGQFPPSFLERRGTFERVLREPDDAWTRVAASGATHAIVHEAAFVGQGPEVSRWLESHGARLVLAAEDAKLYELRR